MDKTTTIKNQRNEAIEEAMEDIMDMNMAEQYIKHGEQTRMLYELLCKQLGVDDYNLKTIVERMKIAQENMNEAIEYLRKQRDGHKKE